MKSTGILAGTGLFINPISGEETQKFSDNNGRSIKNPDIEIVDNSDSESEIKIYLKEKATGQELLSRTIPTVGVNHPNNQSLSKGEFPSQAVEKINKIDIPFTGELEIKAEHDGSTNSISANIGRNGIGGTVSIRIEPDGRINMRIGTDCF
jgi:hypothetical protein